MGPHIGAQARGQPPSCMYTAASVVTIYLCIYFPSLYPDVRFCAHLFHRQPRQKQKSLWSQNPDFFFRKNQGHVTLLRWPIPVAANCFSCSKTMIFLSLSLLEKVFLSCFFFVLFKLQVILDHRFWNVSAEKCQVPQSKMRCHQMINSSSAVCVRNTEKHVWYV